jgi:type I restriction enzyme R subunit
MSKVDICRVIVNPALQKAGCGDPVWRMTEPYNFTDGQTVLIGDGQNRQKGKNADYLLRYEKSLPIAVSEAKPVDLEPISGLQQAKGYAIICGCSHTFSINGHGSEEPQ